MIRTEQIPRCLRDDFHLSVRTECLVDRHCTRIAAELAHPWEDDY